MARQVRKPLVFLVGMILLVAGVSIPTAAKKKKSHPYDFYDHEMHIGFFEVAGVACDMCHADPESFADRSKVYPLGCHRCHNSPKPILPATNDCKTCHKEGPPKPESHRADWVKKHQAYAKQDPKECLTCHTNQSWCIDCHKKRDTVEKRMHRRNFRLFHSIEARANPRKCDACHTVNYCQECHAGRGSSKR